jgi:hypothetical protein
MAKMFFTAEEAIARLGTTEEGLKGFVREGRLREFRDGDTVNYKIDEVEAVAGEIGVAEVGVDADAPGDASASATDEVLLEPVEESGVELALSGTDVISLEDAEAEDLAAATKSGTSAEKQGSAVPSVGVNVFDDDELDEQVDPLAQTAVTDVAGLGIDGAGSGSGILDLTRESDDTSLGAELLEEIYTEEDEGESDAGEDTRAGLEEVPAGVPPTADEDALEVDAEEAAPVIETPVAVTQVVEYAPDAVSAGLTALMAVAVVVMGFGGLAVAALVRGTVPGLLRSAYSSLGLYAGVALGVAIVAGAATFFLAKRSS